MPQTQASRKKKHLQKKAVSHRSLRATVAKRLSYNPGPAANSSPQVDIDFRSTEVEAKNHAC